MTICTIMSGHCGNRLRTKYRVNDDYDENVDEVNVVRFRGTGTGSTLRAPRTTTTTT